MSIVSLHKATSRNTPSHWVYVSDVKILFSYQTAIALQYYKNNNDGTYERLAVRRSNAWGPTTGRHMNDAGVRHWNEVSEEEFNRLLEQAIIHTFAERSAEEFAKLLVDKLPKGGT